MGGSGFVVTVLSGPQAGVAQPVGAGAYVIGSDDSCDLVFDDVDLAPRHARLRIDRRGVAVDPLDGLVDLSPAGGRRGRDLELGVPQRLPALVAMGRLKLMIVDDGRGLRDRAGDLAATAPILHQAQRAGFSLPGIGAFAAAACVAALGVWAVASFFGPGVNVAQAGATVEERMEQAVARLDDRFIARRDQVGWVIEGAVQGPEERGRVTELFDGIDAPIEFRLRDRDKLQSAVEAVTAAFGGEVDVAVDRRGDVRLRGYVPDRDMAQRLIAAVRDDVVGVGSVQTDLFTDASIAAAFNQRLRAEGLDDQIEATVKDGRIEARGGIGASQEQRWQRVVDWHQALFARYAPLDQQIGTRSDGPPLRISAVSHGDPAYIVGADGAKYMIGAVLEGGWVVEAIETDSVTISRDGQRLVLTL